VNLHLLDATYELFRAYFGYPRRAAPDGMEVGAVYGVLDSTIRLLREDGVTHLAAATDAVIESFRNEIFPGYKTGEGIEPELLAQFRLAEEALEILGVTVWAMRDFEADDAIATAAHRWKDDVERVIILSPDKDLMQCVIGDRVVTYNRRERKRYDERGVVEKFGIRPSSIPDYLGLVGDSADGFPGLRGWGAKSTSVMLSHYGHIENIPDSHDDWAPKVRGAAGLAATLAGERDLALLFRRIATVRTDAPVSDSVDELAWRGPHSGFEDLCEQIGAGPLLERVMNLAAYRADL